MTLILDDTGDKCKLTIIKKDKVIYKKIGSIKSLLKMVYNGTNKDNVRESIMELQKVYPFMVDSKTTIEIKENE